MTRMNKRGQSGLELMGIMLIIGVLFGGVVGGKLKSLNPFSKSGSATTVQKTNETKEEYFRDKIKGFEYRSKETTKNQNKQVVVPKQTWGTMLGNTIQKYVTIFILGMLFLFFFIPSMFYRIVNRMKRSMEVHKQKAEEARKALKQVVKGIEKAKPKLNGEQETLKSELSKAQDEQTEVLVRSLRNE